MPKSIIYVVSVMLLIGAAPLPYGYYSFLRIVVTIAFSWAAYASYERHVNGFPWVFAGIALLFNPLIPVHLSKSTWIVLDVASGLLLLACLWILREQRSEQQDQRIVTSDNSDVHYAVSTDSSIDRFIFSRTNMRAGEELQKELRRTKLVYNLAKVLYFLLLKIPFFCVSVAITLDAFNRHLLAGLFMLFIPVFAFIALFVIPDDGFEPFAGWKVRISELEHQIGAK